MRHVPLSDLQANATELTAAIDAGEQVVVTIRGREYRLVTAEDVGAPAVDDRTQAMANLQQFRADLRSRGVRVTSDEWVSWKNEGRR